MATVQESIVSITRLSNSGQLTLPDFYQRALPHDARLAVIPIGEALVIVPYDDAFASVTGRLESALQERGVSVEELIAAAEEARAEIVREEFGDLNQSNN